MNSSIVRRAELAVAGTRRDEKGRWYITAITPRGRTVFFTTSRGDFCREKIFSATYHKIKKTGEIEGLRFVSWVSVQVDRSVEKGATLTRKTFLQRLGVLLNNFRNGLGYWEGKTRSAEIMIEGFLVRVVPTKNGWFKTPNGEHHANASGVASWILKRLPELENLLA